MEPYQRGNLTRLETCANPRLPGEYEQRSTVYIHRLLSNQYLSALTAITVEVVCDPVEERKKAGGGEGESEPQGRVCLDGEPRIARFSFQSCEQNLPDSILRNLRCEP